MTDHHQDHEEDLTLHIAVMLPGHDDRVDTPEFVHTRHTMVAVKDLPCYYCGSKEQRQVHHYHIERCLAERIEWGPDSQLRKDFPNFDWANAKSIYDFVDSEENCRVICQPCHTGRDLSIHFTPYPLFAAIRYMTQEQRDKYIIHHQAKKLTYGKAG